jgi:TetR/AcrR family transcriptional repressor of nem operon
MGNGKYQKSEKTQKKIIKAAAFLFNRRGYAGTSIHDIMEATGLSRGCIYGQFKNKQEIAMSAFQYNIKNMFGFSALKVKRAGTSIKKLYCMLDFHLDNYGKGPYKYGCPILNTSIEVDDTNREILEIVHKAVNSWRLFIIKIIKAGIKKGEIKDSINPDEFAVKYISLVEGGIFLSKIYKNADPLKKNIDYLKKIIREEMS